MQQAIIDGDVQEIKQLIVNYGKEVVNAPEPTGLPPVMRCIFEGQIAPLRLLVAAGSTGQWKLDSTARWSKHYINAKYDGKLI